MGAVAAEAVETTIYQPLRTVAQEGMELILASQAQEEVGEVAPARVITRRLRMVETVDFMVGLAEVGVTATPLSAVLQVAPVLRA
jgi:hypothetical protein